MKCNVFVMEINIASSFGLGFVFKMKTKAMKIKSSDVMCGDQSVVTKELVVEA